nr:hypothetical protein OsI_14951 [Ipomoea trifida]
MDPLGPPVFVKASYVPASCHLQIRRSERTYAKRSMRGAMFMLEMTDRRSALVSSISFRYSASTAGATAAIGSELEKMMK